MDASEQEPVEVRGVWCKEGHSEGPALQRGCALLRAPLTPHPHPISPSFVLLLAGWANLLLAGTFALVDAAQAWDGAPFRFVGANSLAIYLTSELLAKHVPFVTYFNASGDWASHSEALASNCLFVVALLVLARFWNLHGWSYNV